MNTTKGKRQRDDTSTLPCSTLTSFSDINGGATSPLNAADTLSKFESLASTIWKSEEANDGSALQQGIKNAAAFLLSCTINVPFETKTSAFRIVEVESYFYGGGGFHEDSFTHAFPEQGSTGEWYFHRVTPAGGFKGGTFKGMDVTFGNATKKHFGGFLIRSIQPQGSSTPQVIIEGPSLVVDKLLAAAKCPNVSDFVTVKGVVSIASSPMTLSFQGGWAPQEYMCVSPRVGLVPRKPSDLSYAGRPYRFHVISPESITPLGKVRSGIIASLLASGVPALEVTKLTGGQKQLILKLETIVTSILSSPSSRSELLTTINASIDSQNQFLKSSPLSNSKSKGAAAAEAEKLAAHVFRELKNQNSPHLDIITSVIGGDVKESTVIAKVVTIATAQNQYSY